MQTMVRIKPPVLALQNLWQTLTLTFFIGVVVGGLTLLGQGILPGSFSQIANSGAVWVVPAFFLASLTTSNTLAINAGIATLFGEVLGYYGFASFKYGLPDSYSFVALWLIIGLVFGPVFAIAGHWWRGEDAGHRNIAVALLGAVFIAEGIYLIAIVQYPIEGIGGIVIGLLIPLVMSRSNTERLYALLAILPAILLGVVGYLVISLISTRL
ncbi:MAG: hypothetical protein H0X24_09825 [Ktedonobacterales bacterium]|nr:hypothetical protein [Ktedonobacterales bacterium]